jgi:hypothetical protein
MTGWEFFEEDGARVEVGPGNGKGEFTVYEYTDRDGWQVINSYVMGGEMKTALYRATRTALQLVAGGGLTALVTVIAGGLTAHEAEIVMAVNTVAITYAQNLLEDLGWVKPILK